MPLFELNMYPCKGAQGVSGMFYRLAYPDNLNRVRNPSNTLIPKLLFTR